MVIEQIPLNPQELVVLMVALGGLIPICLYYGRVAIGLLAIYAFLVIGAVTTNLENLFWHDGLNFIEHSIGNLGAGVGFGLFAYWYRDRHHDEQDRERLLEDRS